jgi:starch phosphorylase
VEERQTGRGFVLEGSGSFDRQTALIIDLLQDLESLAYSASSCGSLNFFLFGLTADQVASNRPWYNPQWHYENEPEIRVALDLIFSGHFNREEPGIFEPLRGTLLTHGDYYMHLADLTSYVQAQERLGELYADSDGWARKAILNVAGSGKFSSDRTIAEYASKIWGLKPCPVS